MSRHVARVVAMVTLVVPCDPPPPELLRPGPTLTPKSTHMTNVNSRDEHIEHRGAYLWLLCGSMAAQYCLQNLIFLQVPVRTPWSCCCPPPPRVTRFPAASRWVWLRGSHVFSVSSQIPYLCVHQGGHHRRHSHPRLATDSVPLRVQRGGPTSPAPNIVAVLLFFTFHIFAHDP